MSVVQTNLGEAEDINYSRNTVVDSSFTHLQQVIHSLKYVNNQLLTSQQNIFLILQSKMFRIKT